MYKRINPTKENVVLITYIGLRVFGYLLINTLKIMERIVRHEYGITKRRPAST